MGNTPSSPTSTKLARDSSLISRPRALGSIRSPRHPLGPEYIISPFTDDTSSPTSSPTTTHHQPGTYQHDSSNSITQKLAHRRSQTFAASRTNLNESAVDIRRSRSANAAGPTRATRTSEFLGAPPPYSPDDPSSPTRQPLDTYGGFLDVPAGSHWTKGHQRAASEEAPVHRRGPSEQSFSGEYERQTLSEEYGYGIGNGMRPESSHTRIAMPTPRLSIHTSSPSDTVSSPASVPPSEQLRENPLELLKQYKTIFIIDDSASMTGERWVETREALASLADTAAKYDVNGIDVYFLNARRSAESMRTGASVKRQFDSVEPHGLSLLARRLEELLHDYISELEQAQREILRGDTHALRRIKPMNYIIITDGVPTDDPEAVIIQAARRLDRGNLPVSQVGIQFVQVGDDPRAAEALRELDDDLAKEYGIRDMVDTTPYSGGPLDCELLIKILLGGINRRVDKKGASSVL